MLFFSCPQMPCCFYPSTTAPDISNCFCRDPVFWCNRFAFYHAATLRPVSLTHDFRSHQIYFRGFLCSQLLPFRTGRFKLSLFDWREAFSYFDHRLNGWVRHRSRKRTTLVGKDVNRLSQCLNNIRRKLFIILKEIERVFDITNAAHDELRNCPREFQTVVVDLQAP